MDAESLLPHHRRCTVTRTAEGWRVREEDACAVRHATYKDWHRVERAVARFDWCWSEKTEQCAGTASSTP